MRTGENCAGQQKFGDKEFCERHSKSDTVSHLEVKGQRCIQLQKLYQ